MPPNGARAAEDHIWNALKMWSKYGGFYNFAAFLALAFNPSDRALEGPTSSPYDALADAG